jgi:ArsR family transcriptional regulator
MKEIEYEHESEVLKALGHPVRLKLIILLMSDECCVTDLTNILQLPQSTISQHLGILKNAGILHPYKSGVRTCYKIENRKVIEIVSILKS